MARLLATRPRRCRRSRASTARNGVRCHSCGSSSPPRLRPGGSPSGTRCSHIPCRSTRGRTGSGIGLSSITSYDERSAPAGRNGATVLWDSTVLPPSPLLHKRARPRGRGSSKPWSRPGGLAALWRAVGCSGSRAILAGLPEVSLSGVIGVRSRLQRRDRPGFLTGVPLQRGRFQLWAEVSRFRTTGLGLPQDA